ncbi:MAG TPA: serpin family protein [Phycisphaerae bacterium]|nr:serpin family protein [Phycisphaerae bacterium]
MRRGMLGVMVLVVLASSQAAVGAVEQPTAPPQDAAQAEDVAKVAEGCNRFAFDLYARLKGAEGNLFLSPYSISTALTMTYAGARGRTAEQMAKVLCLPATGEAVHGAYGALQNDLNAAGEGGAFELAVANRLWGQKGYGFLPDFLALIKANYGAGLEQVDFAGATEAARQTINTWVEKKTRDKIKELLKPGILGRETTLVLTNAIYFKGKWAEEFDKKLTRDEDFFVTPEKTVAVPLMHQTADFGYFEGDGLQALELPYRGDRLAMVVLLPKAKDGLAALEASLSADKVAEWVGKLHRREVQVALPRFKTTAEFSLKDTLVAMGMAAAFGGDADFSGMTGAKDLFISAVVHKAFVDVNEEGTEAAAATAVVMGRAAMPEPAPVFCADHPFLFLIRDTKTGAILFFGRILDPTK